MDVTKNTTRDRFRWYWNAVSYADSTCRSLGYEYTADYSRFLIGIGWHVNKMPIRLSEVSRVFLAGQKMFTANEVYMLDFGSRSTPSCRESHLYYSYPAFKGGWDKYKEKKLNYRFTELWCEGDSEKVGNEAVLRSLIELSHQDAGKLTESLRRIIVEMGVSAGETPSDLVRNLGKRYTAISNPEAVGMPAGTVDPIFEDPDE
jgi:hypothetical protein